MSYWLSAAIYTTSQNTTENYSNVRVDLYMDRDSGSAWNAYTTYGSITLNGSTQSFSVASYDTSSRNYLTTKDFRVYHNSDGTKSFSWSATYNADNAPYVSTLNVSGTHTLATIPRAASISSVSWTNIESAFSVAFTKPSTSFTYNLRVSIPNVNAIARFNSYSPSTSVSLTLAQKTSVYQYMVNNGLSSLNLGFVIETYNGSTKIGESAEPTRTVTRANVSSISTNANSYTTGTAIAVTIGRNNSAYTHRLYYKLNNSILVTRTPTTSDSYTITASAFGGKYPNNTSGSLQLYLETYYNTVLLGSSSKTVTINLSAYTPPTPTLSLALVNNNSVVNSWGIYLKGYSKYTATLSDASGTYSSTVSRYIFNNTEYTTSSITSGTITTSGTLTVAGYYRDSRGKNSTAVSRSVTVYDYNSPSVSIISASRYNGTAVDEEGTQVLITATFSCASCNGKNSVTARAYIKEDTASSYTELGAITSGTAKVFNAVTLDISKVYVVLVIATDALGVSSTVTRIVSTASAIIDVLKGGGGVSIGKMASKTDTFDVFWNANFDKNVTVASLTLKGNTITVNGQTVNLTKVMIFDGMENGKIKFHTLA